MLPVIDLHIHIAAQKEPGCMVSKRMRRLLAWPYMLIANGIDPAQLEKDFDGTIRQNILRPLSESKSVTYGVLLAMDGRFSKPGSTPDSDSDFITTNDYVRRLARDNDKVLFGASINPNRGELEGRKELDRCLEQKPRPVLMKWVPNSQGMNPTEKRHEWFYKLLADAKLPLLCHTGPEYAIPVEKGNQKLGHPRLLSRALDIGVTVIAAHAATRFFPFEKGDYVEALASLMEKHNNLYADVSAMCVACRALGTVDKVLDFIPEDRMLLGSDYPVPVNNMPWPFMKDLTLEEFFEIMAIPNPIEKNYRQLLAMGFPASIGTQAVQKKIIRL